jgi:hypothetical protein
MTQATVTEGGDNVTVTTARALGRHLKRVRRDLPTAELTVLLGRTVRTDVLEAVRTACRDAGFARLQVKSADGRPFDLVEAAPADDLRSAAAVANAMKFLMSRGPSSAADTSATAMGLVALAQAAPVDRGPLDGMWAVQQVMTGNTFTTFDQGKAQVEWIVIGSYLVTRNDLKYTVGRIFVQPGKDTNVIEFSYGTDTPRHMMHRGKYTLTDGRLVIELPGSPGWWGGKSLPEMLTLEHLDAKKP